MENQIQIFKNEQFGEVRTVMNEQTGEPWFCAKDICDALGYDQARKAVERHVDIPDGMKRTIRSNGQNREMLFVNESGLYSLILSSKLPQAKAFKRWVTSEVLPTIRKHGAYMTEQSINRAIREPDFLIELATNLKQEMKLRTEAEQRLLEHKQIIGQQSEKIEELTGQVSTMQKKVSYLDLILATDDSVTITQIAQDYGMSAIAMNQLLKEKRIQRKVGGQWILYSQYIAQCYVRSEVAVYNDSNGEQHTKQHTKWTQKGRLFLYNLLKADGRLPLIERQEPPTLFDKAQ